MRLILFLILHANSKKDADSFLLCVSLQATNADNWLDQTDKEMYAFLSLV